MVFFIKNIVVFVVSEIFEIYVAFKNRQAGYDFYLRSWHERRRQAIDNSRLSTFNFQISI